MLAYITNEPYILKQKGYESKIFYPKDYGFDFYEELIFTSKELAKKDPKLVNDFFKASIKGWEYAFNNIDEVAKLIYKKYNPQNKSLDSLIYEANEMKKLVFDKNGKIGTVSENKINLIINTYKLMGYIKSEINLDEFIFKYDTGNILTSEEKSYLKNKKFITMCVEPDWLPYEKIEDGKHIGIAADYMNLMGKAISTKIKLIPTKNWSQTLQYARERKCDIVSTAINTKKRREYLTFTDSYMNASLAILSAIDRPFVDNIQQVKNEKFAVVKDYAYANLLIKKYPYIKFVEVMNMKEGIKLVKKGEVFGFIDTLPTLAYAIQKDYIGQLKITGKLEEQSNLSVGVRNDEPILRDILNKALSKITPLQKQKILNKWISINYQKNLDYKFMSKFLFGVFIVVLIFALLYRQFLLKDLNKKLNKRVKEEIEKNEENNKILLKQSRMASMGEMLENIAHQWRQPLGEINAVLMEIETITRYGKLEEEHLLKSIKTCNEIAEHMSTTISDFQNFFKPSKQKDKFSVLEVCKKAIAIINASLKNNNIELSFDIQEDNTIEGYSNEFSHAILNIISNAKDALISRKIQNPKITLSIKVGKEFTVIKIEDNAGGIKLKDINLVFEPYFTTKGEKRGTGIGLYMTKVIIEDNMHGFIDVKNTKEGALFRIKVK
jgi:signal transduction histidine kinase